MRLLLPWIRRSPRRRTVRERVRAGHEHQVRGLITPLTSPAAAARPQLLLLIPWSVEGVQGLGRVRTVNRLLQQKLLEADREHAVSSSCGWAGSVLSVGFEQILLQQPIYGADAAQTLDTFVYFRGINGGDWGLATAAGLVKGVIAPSLYSSSARTRSRSGSAARGSSDGRTSALAGEAASGHHRGQVRGAGPVGGRDALSVPCRL